VFISTWCYVLLLLFCICLASSCLCRNSGRLLKQDLIGSACAERFVKLTSEYGVHYPQLHRRQSCISYSVPGWLSNAVVRNWCWPLLNILLLRRHLFLAIMCKYNIILEVHNVSQVAMPSEEDGVMAMGKQVTCIRNLVTIRIVALETCWSHTVYCSTTGYYYYTRLTASFPGQPG